MHVMRASYEVALKINSWRGLHACDVEQERKLEKQLDELIRSETDTPKHDSESKSPNDKRFKYYEPENSCEAQNEKG